MKDTANPIDYHYEPKFKVYEPLDLKLHHITNLPLGLYNEWLNWDACTFTLRCLCYRLTTLTFSEVHFVAALHIMSYLNGKHKSCLALSLTNTANVYEKF